LKNVSLIWNKIYDTADKDCVRAKGAIHLVIKELFPDFSMKKAAGQRSQGSIASFEST